MGFDDVLIVTDELDENLLLSSRNLPNVLVLEARDADPVSLVRFKNVLVTKGAVAQARGDAGMSAPDQVQHRAPDDGAARAGGVREGHVHRREARAGVPRRCPTRPSPRSRPRSS